MECAELLCRNISEGDCFEDSDGSKRLILTLK